MITWRYRAWTWNTGDIQVFACHEIVKKRGGWGRKELHFLWWHFLIAKKCLPSAALRLLVTSQICYKADWIAFQGGGKINSTLQCSHTTEHVTLHSTTNFCKVHTDSALLWCPPHLMSCLVCFVYTCCSVILYNKYFQLIFLLKFHTLWLETMQKGVLQKMPMYGITKICLRKM